jgi:MarR family transcriptional regulator, 2-MHQ and catechol-resistance regulon repressor
MNAFQAQDPTRLHGALNPRGSGREPVEAGDPADPADSADSAHETSLRLWVSLVRAYHTVAKAVAAQVAEEGLTIPQFAVLEALHHLGPLSHRELADKLLVTGGNITFVMGRLEETGLVERERSELDRRVVEARLTPAGRALVERVFPEHARHIRNLFAHLDTDAQDTLRELLKRLGKGI